MPQFYGPTSMYLCRECGWLPCWLDPQSRIPAHLDTTHPCPGVGQLSMVSVTQKKKIVTIQTKTLAIMDTKADRLCETCHWVAGHLDDQGNLPPHPYFKGWNLDPRTLCAGTGQPGAGFGWRTRIRPGWDDGPLSRLAVHPLPSPWTPSLANRPKSPAAA